jgi:hypothetical protein
MGHSFNLAHSWQKALGTQWIPLMNEPQERSFMNYPYNVTGGQSAFFADFQFRFSDQELLFARHAPFRFVEQGNANWFDNHGFEQARVSREPKLGISIESARKGNRYEFLEPIVLTLRLRNISDEPQLVDEKILASPENTTVILKKQGRPARKFTSFVQRCWQPKNIVLTPGQEMSDSLFISAGLNGWDISEPGNYTVQMALHLENEDIVSPPLAVRVYPPRGYDEEVVAQDLFNEDPGRVMAMDGTRYLDAANNALRQVVEKLPATQAAIHARVALGAPLAAEYKQVVSRGTRRSLAVGKPDFSEARRLLAVLNEPSSAETLSQIDYNYYRARFDAVLADAKAAKASRTR